MNASAEFTWTAAAVAEALGVTADATDTYPNISTDSRSVGAGDLFVALVGEQFDGHDYVGQAVAAGARGVVVSRSITDQLVGAEVPVATFLVADTLTAYGALAAHRRAVLRASVVAITGSSGKTTTKDLTAGALSASLRTHATEANYNNRIGLPRTILEAPSDTEVMVLEMGTNEPGEIEALTQVAQPDIGVVTTVSESHLEGLGSLDGVLEEKLALVRGLHPTGRAFVGEDPPVLAATARESGRDVVVAGLTDRADRDLRATDLSVRDDGSFKFVWNGQDVALRIPGEAAVVDALLALGVARSLGVSAEAAARGVGAVGPGWLRGEVRHLGGMKLVLDCYNANPQSVRAAVRTLERMPSRGQRVLVLGSMLELGSASAALHAEVLGEVVEASLDRIYVSGAFADAASHSPVRSVVCVRDVDALASVLAEELDGSETVLLKASRGVRLERVVSALEQALGPASGGEVN